MIYYVEKYGPLAASVISVALLVYFRSDLNAAATSGTVDFGDLYSAVFDWSAIQTGFLFGIFGYVGGKTSGFIAELRDTREMAMFIGYTKAAMWLGFVITFCSIPLVVTGHKIQGSTLAYTLFCGWCFFSVWGFFAFARVAYLFGLLIRPKDREPTLPA